MSTRRFELIEGTSSRFWEIDVEGAEHTVRFGRIGAEGQANTKTFRSTDEADADAARLIRDKTRKGYREIGVAAIDGSTQTAAPPRFDPRATTPIRRRFEKEDGGARLYIEIEVHRARRIVASGRDGVPGGPRLTKGFESPAAAVADADALVAAKLRDGYVEVLGGASGGATHPLREEEGARLFQQIWGLAFPADLVDLCRAFRALGKEQARALPQDTHFDGVSVLLSRALRTREGVDPRLHGRHFRDPPELVTVLTGNTDGLHFGLWYDDPKLPPAFLLRSYARKEEPFTFAGETAYDVLVRRLEDAIVAGWAGDAKEARAVLLALRPNSAAPVTRPPPFDNPSRIATCSGVRVWAPGGKASDRYADVVARGAIGELLSEGALRPAVDEAVARCRAGDPAEALALGHDLHFYATADHPERATAAVELLEAAYRALGREALAGVLKVHEAHRDLPSAHVIL